MARIEIRDDKSVVVHRTNSNRTSAWDEILAPGETERAAAVLDSDELAQVSKAWTTETVDAWRKANPDYVPEPVTERVTDADRIAQLEETVRELTARVDALNDTDPTTKE
jgi:hypothetical protein